MAETSETGDGTVPYSEEHEAPDYRLVNVPKGIDPAEYNHFQRRAQILKFIEQAGHPQALNKAELGRRYDVSDTTIGHDFDKLRGFVLDNIETEQADMISQVGFQQSIKKLQEQERPKDAAKVIKWWNDWLFDRGKVEKEPEKHEHGHEMSPAEAYMRMLEEAGDEGDAAAAAEDTSPTSDVIEVAAEEVVEDERDEEAADEQEEEEEEDGAPLTPPEPDEDYDPDDADAEDGAADAGDDADSDDDSGDSDDTDDADDAATADSDGGDDDTDDADDGWQRATGGDSDDDWEGDGDAGDDDLDDGEGMSGAERGRRRSGAGDYGKSPEERRKDYRERREERGGWG